MKLARLEFSVELLEAILTARNNDYVTTNCPNDVKIVRVLQEKYDQVNNRIVLVLESEEASWPDTGKLGMVSFDDIPMIDPFEYTVLDPESPPTTEEKSDG
jgi:hypothetical protein